MRGRERVRCGWLALLCLAGTAWSQITLVDGGKARVVVVTARQPAPIAIYAAQELVDHVQRATGVRLDVVREEAIPDTPVGRVYVGATEAARNAGIDTNTLAAEVAVLRTMSNALFIVGRDGSGAALEFNNPWSGTLWGVYELLERQLGVRWLWPGDLGTYVPHADRVTIGKLDEQIPPRFARRSLRPFARGNDPRLGFSKDGLRQYQEAERVFLRRQRMGRNDDPRPYTGHSFTSWWKQYGAQHPEWFELRALGQRGPLGDSDRFVMCVSNPGLPQEIVRRFADSRKKNPAAPPVISIGENDRHAVCTCDACRAWDDPEPDAATLAALPRYARSLYHPYNSGARYARFWKAVYDQASAIDTNVIVTALIYSYYSVAPQQKIELNPHIVLAFCPYGPHTPVPPAGESVPLLASLFSGGSQRNWWFPRYPEEQTWIKSQWDQWRATGATLYLRPNYTLDGYAMPHAYAHQFADQFQYFAAHGMLGADFDSLLGQWAAQGPTLYLLARLHVRPETAVEDLLTEYYSAFGPAAPRVREYFDYWERHTLALLPRIEGVLLRTGAAQWGTYPRMAHELFPPAAFEAAEAALAGAEAAVADGPAEYRNRVAFLRAGSTHARLCVEAAARFADSKATAGQRRAALDNLAAFRKSVEGQCIANYQPLCQEEQRSWGGSEGFFSKP